MLGMAVAVVEVAMDVEVAKDVEDSPGFVFWALVVEETVNVDDEVGNFIFVLTEKVNCDVTRLF